MSIYQAEFFVGRSETVTMSASVVAPIVRGMVAPTSLLDLGCAQREWLDAFGLPEMVGVDIAGGPGIVQHDLTEPLDLGRRFDLALCLEVGEHLPEDAAGVLVDSIARHADEVLFSAAVPGQEGTGHIHCRPHEYWHDLFADRGYGMEDTVRPLIANDSRVSPWYRNNLFLYCRHDR